MAQKKIPWYEPRMSTHELVYLKQVLKTHHPNHGTLTRTFEQKIASLVGSAHAVAVPSGTAALFLALKALGIKSGDEVIVPDITFIATANAVDLCGAKPVLVDIDPKTLTIDCDAFKKAITKKTRAVIPVHVSGRGADMDTIMAIAEKHRLFVVEDAAEALASKYKKGYLGTFGHAGCFSFSAMKIITSGQGGMIVTQDEMLAQKIRALRNQGIAERGTGGDDIHPDIGYNFKFTDIQAAVALGQLHYLRSRIEHSRARHHIYTKALSNLSELSLLPFNTAAGELPLWTDIRTARRDALDVYLRAQNIDCRKFWLPLHHQAPYRRSDDRFPNSSKLSYESLWLPSAFTLRDMDVRTVCQAIQNFFKNS